MLDCTLFYFSYNYEAKVFLYLTKTTYKYLVYAYIRYIFQKKNNAEFPDPFTVKREIIHMCKGLFVATLCPAFTLMMSKYVESLNAEAILNKQKNLFVCNIIDGAILMDIAEQYI